MSLSSSLAGLHPQLRPWAEWLIAHYPTATVTSTRRTRAEQTRLYRRYLNGQSSFPARPPGTSKHELGLAWDMVTEPRSVLWQLGRLWQSVGGTWGGERDPIHFEV